MIDDGNARVHAFIDAAPKVELHVHLLGAARPETVVALAERHPDVGVAADLDAIRELYRYTDFEHFIVVYWIITHLVRTEDDLALVVDDVARSLAEQRVRYAEITVTAQARLRHGMRPEQVRDVLSQGVRDARRDHDLDLAWIYDIPGGDPIAADQTLHCALDHPPDDLVGFGLGGLELGVDRRDYVAHFDAARAAGLRSVPHAGEADGPASVRAALDQLGAERLGHGIRSIEDPELLARIVDEQIPLEVCPSSNVCTGVVPDLASHPLPRLVDAGAVVTINSDDPPMFDTTLTDEYRRIVDTFGYGVDDVVRFLRAGIDASFAPATTKARIHAELDEVRRTRG